MLTLLLPPERLRSPEALVAVGFACARVVMVNEAHAGLRRCIRTRAVGRRMLHSAHGAGVRHLAMEALDPWFAAEANQSRTLPATPSGYLAQPDLRELMGVALALGWELIAYEANPLRYFGYSAEPLAPPTLSADEHAWLQTRWRTLFTRAYAGWRAAQQADNLCTALAALPSTARLLVWCGNRHLHRPVWGRTMARCFEQASNLRPFVIDQTVTVQFAALHPPPLLRAQTRAALHALGGTAGYVAFDLPWAPWRHLLGVDAWLISLQNRLE